MTIPFYKLRKDLTSRKDFQSSDKIIFAVIDNYQGDNGDSWPGISSLMDDTGLARQTVLDSIKRLENSGCLEVVRQGKGKSNRYKTSLEIRPVQKLDQSENQTTTSPESRPEPVQNSDSNKKDLFNKTYISQFDEARKAYPGTRRKKETELKNFQKHKDWQEVLPLLQPAIENQKRERFTKQAVGQFVPAWKNFKTWINQRCWEDETPIESQAAVVPFDHKAAEQRKAQLALVGANK